MGHIRVSGLAKAYKQYPNRWSRLFEWLVPFSRPRHHLHWVLQDVDFEIQPGEAVGIVGVNGAGKSTLLKMITGTTQPTCGQIQLQGRVAALLELGMGFHPDFTGRQNAFMAGQLLGMQVEEIDALMPQIESFAEIGEAIDQPVRTYSSGMQMRVAFAVATAFRPDILIVDEALSVGDSYFQHKSFERIREFQRQGTTLLIVSHDRGSIQALCDRAILLEKGTVIKDGNPEEVMDFYNALIAEKENSKVEVRELEDGSLQTRSGSGEASIGAVTLHNAAGERIEFASVGEPVSLRVQTQINSPIPELVVGYMIKDRLGQPVFGTNTHHLGCTLHDLQAGETPGYSFNFIANLGVGSYSVAVALHTTDSHLARNYEWVDLTLVFNVVNISQGEFVGLAWIPPTVECHR